MLTRESAESFSPEVMRLREEIERKHGKSPEQLYAEREKRVLDTVALREPDRVPVVLNEGVFAARYAGLPVSVMYYDNMAYRDACRKMILDFEPDLCQATGPATAGAGSGRALELLESKIQRWPGGNLPDDVPYQFVEGEYMLENEYDIFLNDPSDFVLRYFLPRAYGALEPLTKLPALRNLSGAGVAGINPRFASDEFMRLAEILHKAGKAQMEVRKSGEGWAEEMAALGFPAQGGLIGGAGGAPFDLLADNLRGMRGAMTDMYRCPDKLLAACEKIVNWRIANATPPDPSKPELYKIVSRPLHKGAEGFMSVKQFETYYWPGLKKAVLADIEMGYIVRLGWQGKLDSRLEYFLDLPRGKVICWFEGTDMARAKAILGDHICISGNVPLALLYAGSPSEVEDYCKNLIKTCGKGGGFILASAGSLDDAKPANVKAMVDSVKKYGVN
jgi:uroporphyrinogen-III decarboxylase